MSGPVLLELTGDIFGGPSVNSIVINGTQGIMALYVQPIADSEVFLLTIAGKLNMKEKVCGKREGTARRPKRSATLVPVCGKVKP